MGILFGDTYNRTEYITENRYPQTVNHGPITVTEKRAPTDDSIRILGEMQDKVIKNIIGKLKTEDNIFHASGMLVKDELNFSYKIVTRYTINKQERVVITVLDEFEIKNIEKAFDKILTEVMKDFAQMVVGQTYTKYWNELLIAANR